MNNKLRFTINLLLLFLILIPGLSFADFTPPERQLPRLVDNAYLLTDNEEAKILKKLDEISERQNFDVVIITVDSLGGYTPSQFADDAFDYNGFGIGPNYDGILFLISMEERDWAISTHGFGINAFTDAGQDYMVKQFRPYLSDGDFYKAFDKFADLSDEFITAAKNGKPYTSSSLPKRPFSITWVFTSVIIGAIVSFVITGFMKSQLKSVRMQRTAISYVRENSLNLVASRDIFLYNVVNKRARPKENKSSGSSTHTSSSGRTHGGSSGKF